MSKTAIEGEDGAYQIMVNGLFTEENIDGGVGIIDFYDANIDNTEDPGNNAHNRYCVTMPAFRDLVKHDANNAVFAFNAEGQYSSTTAGTEVVDDYATAGVSSTAGLKFFVLMPDGYGGYYAAKEKTGWVTVTDDMWDETGEIFQHRDYTIAVTANSGAARSAVLVALPQTLAAEIDENGDLDAQLLKADGSYDLKDEYKPYAFATVEQEAPASGSGDEGLSVICPTDVTTQYYLDNGFFKFEERTRRAELHLWYAVRFGKEFTVDEVISRLSQLGEVQTATPNRVIKRAYREDRKAYPVSQRMLERSSVTRASGDYAYNDVLLPWQWHIINRGYRDNFVIGDTDGKTMEEVQAKYRAGADVNCEKAWERTTGDPSIVVAVLDEGIYWRHPDLVNNMWENEDEPYYSDAAGEHVSYEDRDGNGYAGDHFGYDFINNTGVISCDASADTGHGTHVAGVIAARNNNGIGIASIAGGTEDAPGVKVMSCQIFSGNKTSSTINLVRAIKYAADNGAVILQCNWGYASPAANGFEYSPGFATEEEWEANCPLEKAALDYFVHNAGSPNGPIEGGIPIFASGNEYAAAGGFPGAAEYCISVNATAADYTISTFSNYGEFTDIAAPGGDQDYYYEYFDGDNALGAVGCVLSTLPPQVSNGTGYGYMEGTSMACPHVSGVAALGLSYAVQLRKHFTAEEFRRMLIETASPIDDYLVGTKYYYFYVTDIDKTRYTSVSLSRYHGCSGGLVNAERLLEAIADDAAGSKMTFPNIYLAPGEASAVTETPARYFVGGETLTHTLQIADTSVAEGVITAEGKALFTGVGEGVTTASITASNGETQNFNITVRKGASGSGWL